MRGAPAMILLSLMAHPNAIRSTTAAAGPEEPAWPSELDELLARAAELAAERGIDPQLFVQAAWAACLDARPGLREELEDKELRAHLRKLRKRGVIGLA
jgi:hypothetical protein